MAAMQAQVEPHFLFNTLASIEHLIETDRQARRRTMQRNLIALLRASMPTMREAGDGAPRDLGRELAGDPALPGDPEGAHGRPPGHRASTCPRACCRPSSRSMMIQTLVENAIKHGLEPKPEGGTLTVKAEIVHGKLAVSVADTGLGFGMAAHPRARAWAWPTSASGCRLLYGGKATLAVAAHPPGGTVVTITVPYRSLEGASASDRLESSLPAAPVQHAAACVRAIAARRPAHGRRALAGARGCCWARSPWRCSRPARSWRLELDEPVRVYVDWRAGLQRPRALGSLSFGAVFATVLGVGLALLLTLGAGAAGGGRGAGAVALVVAAGRGARAWPCLVASPCCWWPRSPLSPPDLCWAGCSSSS
jgi:hypothetical protein